MMGDNARAIDGSEPPEGSDFAAANSPADATTAGDDGAQPPLIDLTRRVYVGNIPWSCSVQQIKEHFSGIGPLASCEIVIDRDSGRSKGFAFVSYETREDAQRCMDVLNGTEFCSRPLRLGLAAPHGAAKATGTSSYVGRSLRTDLGAGGRGGAGRNGPFFPRGGRGGVGGGYPGGVRYGYAGPGGMGAHIHLHMGPPPAAGGYGGTLYGPAGGWGGPGVGYLMHPHGHPGAPLPHGSLLMPVGAPQDSGMGGYSMGGGPLSPMSGHSAGGGGGGGYGPHHGYAGGGGGGMPYADPMGHLHAAAYSPHNGAHSGNGVPYAQPAASTGSSAGGPAATPVGYYPQSPGGYPAVAAAAAFQAAMLHQAQQQHWQHPGLPAGGMLGAYPGSNSNSGGEGADGYLSASLAGLSLGPQGQSQQQQHGAGAGGGGGGGEYPREPKHQLEPAPAPAPDGYQYQQAGESGQQPAPSSSPRGGHRGRGARGRSNSFSHGGAGAEGGVFASR